MPDEINAYIAAQPDDVRPMLNEIRTSKGAIQLPLDKPVDRQLISDLVSWNLAHLAR